MPPHVLLASPQVSHASRVPQSRGLTSQGNEPSDRAAEIIAGATKSVRNGLACMKGATSTDAWLLEGAEVPGAKGY
eukprot:1143680-Pelagomonas_calceolata.AAC.3